MIVASLPQRSLFSLLFSLEKGLLGGVEQGWGWEHSTDQRPRLIWVIGKQIRASFEETRRILALYDEFPPHMRVAYILQPAIVNLCLVRLGDETMTTSPPDRPTQTLLCKL